MKFRAENIRTFNWENALEGMRNPLESWDKSDTAIEYKGRLEIPSLGQNDYKLLLGLTKGGKSHRKTLRQIRVSGSVYGCLKWMDELSTYVFLTTNSTSQMHLLGSRLLTEDDFDSIDSDILEIVNRKISRYQTVKKEKVDKEELDCIWRDMINSIPQSFIYKRTFETNYECILDIMLTRSRHKMYEWRELCEQLLNEMPYLRELVEVNKSR